MKQIGLVVVSAVLILSGAASAWAVDLQWSGNCFTMDGGLYLCKPDNKWDTQKTEEALRPVKMVYHKGGSNPVIWVMYDTVSVPSAMSYASTVRARYESRGLKDITVTKEVVAGRDIYIVAGQDEGKGARFAVALVWRSGVSKAFQVEYTAASQDFGTYYPQFMATVQSIRDRR